ncbi:hypothetical protein TAMA11512_06280 [Selenomonas sp. TAMA-11512]|uniref:lytic transglycosylase domain-containing protein n=1 Tax=Selenomonas sp. TAMA-11512 TaxID=3095337 RepID=UPI003087DC4F|nr:hypothetical protein TAMA11512_06280 [Selenomonas sp. TAMA-11512]
MIDIGAIRSIETRILEIQKRFGIEGAVPGAASFQNTLNSALQKIDVMNPVQAPQAAAPSDKPSKASEVNAAAKASGTEPTSSVAHFIEDASARYGVDSKLVSAVAEAESGGNQAAVSEAGAIGIMQLMPGTAASLGVNPYDARENVEGGTKYLKELLDTFGGDVQKAVAAYNAGPQAVKDYGGIPPYPETENYVSKVLDLYL